MRSKPLSRRASIGLLVGISFGWGCVAAEPEIASDEQNLFERNCPHQVIEAVLECDEPGYGSLELQRHVGRYLLEERAVEEDLTGAKELRCEYAPDPDLPWESRYVLDGQERAASSVDDLQELVRELPDLDAEELEVVIPALASPMAVIRYHLGFFGRGDLTYEGLSTGLESFQPSHSEDNPAAAKTNFVIDETAYDAGFGGTYATGTSCRLILSAP